MWITSGPNDFQDSTIFTKNRIIFLVWLADARWALRRAVNFERINVVVRDVPRILGFDLFQKLPSVLLDDLPSSQRGFARRGGGDVQFFGYPDCAHP